MLLDFLKEIPDHRDREGHSGHHVCQRGDAAIRAGQELEFDGPSLRFTNAPAAEQYLHREYRTGWHL